MRKLFLILIVLATLAFTITGISYAWIHRTYGTYFTTSI